MHIGRINPNIQYYIDCFAMPNVHEICDLGLTYNDQLKFEEYINGVAAKAYQRIYLLFRGFVSRDRTLLKRAFCTYVRPLLEYCTPVWNPYLIRDIDKIENVQRYFTRRLFPLSTFSYVERLALLDLDSLELRRLKYDLKVYFQVIHGLTILDSAHFFILQSKSYITRGHGFKLEKQVHSNNLLSNTFANRAIDCWNHLPEQIVTAPNLNQFKKKLNNLDLTKYLHGRTLAP